MKVEKKLDCKEWYEIFMECKQVGRITIREMRAEYKTLNEVWNSSRKELLDIIRPGRHIDGRMPQRDETLCSVKYISGLHLLENGYITESEFNNKYDCFCGGHHAS
jgi:hypothetical protein